MEAKARNNECLPQDILLAILAKVKEKSGKERLEFRAHEEKIQRIIHALQLCRAVFLTSGLLEPGTPDLLSCFVFSDDLVPLSFSPAISDSFEVLSLGGCLCRPYEDWGILRLTRTGEDYFEEVLKNKFSAEELTQLDQIASDFLRFITPLEPGSATV